MPTREALTCFLNMNLLFLVLLLPVPPVSPLLIPLCTCSVAPAGAVGIHKHSWCASVLKPSDAPSPRASPHQRGGWELSKIPHITQIQQFNYRATDWTGGHWGKK